MCVSRYVVLFAAVCCLSVGFSSAVVLNAQVAFFAFCVVALLFCVFV